MSTQTMLASNIDTLFAAARPRLLRQARMHGVAPDAVDDVVQETLLEAWRHLEALRNPDRIDAWLNGILRNVCLRWSHTQSKLATHQIPLLHMDPEDGSASRAAPELELPDSSTFDPVEELSRQDMQVLLDRALTHLPNKTREAIELYYLAELPQREAALRLGLTIHALETRLYRARRQLRQLLNSELRSEAEAFGLQVAQDTTVGWRQTRELCRNCGCHYQLGMLEARPDGHGFLQTRCPSCCTLWGNTNTSGWMPELYGLHSFRPAFKRLGTHMRSFMPQALVAGTYACHACGKLAKLRAVAPGEQYGQFIAHNNYELVLECPACGEIQSMWALGAIFWSHPDLNAFVERYPRWIAEREVMLEYANQPALRFRLLDSASNAQFSIIAHYSTLQVLATFQE